MFVQIDGIDYYAYTAAKPIDPNFETIVFIHGTAMDHTVWALQSRYFAYHGYNILALDLPGHGQSAGQAMDRIDDYAAWLVELMQHSPGSGFHLIGHSMGALICLEAAAQYGQSIPVLNSLSLVGFSYPMAVTPKLLGAAKDNPTDAYAMMTQWSHTSTVGGEPNPGFWSAGSQMSMMENSRPGAVFTDLTACNNYHSGPEAIAKTGCPILFISGAQDKMAPAKLARKEADINPNAEIVTLPRCGHSIMAENPDGVRNALRQFIAQHGSH
ncbi:MAG: alpha/beta fold hydrolase [bacterium]